MSETIASVMQYAVDLGKTIKKTYLDTLFATDDSEAHRFDIILYRDNAKLTIPSGASVSAYFIRYSDNVTIPLKGSVDGNVVSVTLKESCYKKAGQFALIIKAKNGSEEKAVFYGEGAIFTSSTDSILDDEHIIPSLSELLAQIDAMEAATASANTATMNANTATDNANGAAGKANTAANTANTAADNANEATGNANTAAETANAAAGKIDSMTVTATTLETGSPATAALETVDGHYQLNLGLPKGNTGNTGATPQISVQVTTGAAGSEASVSVSGTAEEPVIHLTIPRGDTGAIENMTINGKPVESGTITLTPEDLGAASAESVSQLKNDMAKCRTAVNLLDNSDFEIAQAGYGGKHGSTVYAADRWMQDDTTERTYTYTTKNGHGALKCSTDTRIQQKLHLVDGQNYTAAFYINNTLYILNFTANGAENGSGEIWVNKQSDGTYMFIASNIPAGGIVSEPVLYIGTYTADTLPPYVPKGYAEEFVECRRYYKKTIPAVLYCYADSYLFPFIMEIPMHRVPTYVIVSAYTATWSGISGDITMSDVSDYGVGVFQNASFKSGNYYRLFIEVNADL